MYPKTFDNLYVNMVKAGEAGGVLELGSGSFGSISGKIFEQLRK
jgi:type II secretory pathway component PulF